MEKVPFLRDVDDEKHYAQLLEVAYVEAYTALRQILTDAKLYAKYRAGLPSGSYEMHVEPERLEAMRDAMEHTVQQTVDRRRRLADIAAGLSDVVLDKQSSKE